jgi:hypothetical protein
MLASSTVKLVAACVCPVAGTAALTLGMPKVRSAVHKATAPAPVREAHAKPRIRIPQMPAPRPVGSEGPTIICPVPNLLAGPQSLLPSGLALSKLAPPPELASGAIGGRIARGGSGGFPSIGPGSGGGGGGGGFLPAPDNDGPPGEDDTVPIGPPEGETPPTPGPNPGNPPPSDIPVPEPATWAQMLVGFLLLGGALRLGSKRRARRVARL